MLLLIEQQQYDGNNAVTGSSASATRMKLRGIFVMQPLSTAYLLISIYTSMKRVTYIFMQSF